MLKIVHYADMQIEVRTSGSGAQRLDEFTHDFKQLEDVVHAEQPHIVIIAGDIFEHHISNGEEQKIFAKHLRNILPHTQRIIIIPGNHDVRQRGIALDTIADSKRNITDSIDPIVTAIGSSKISYYVETGIYKDTEFDINWAVWSQSTKHSMSEPKPAYSPWDELEAHDIIPLNCIELFHDPIRGARDFSGEANPVFSNYKIGLDNFRANTIIAGDIHAPSIIWFGDDKKRLFTYSSSTTQRNFGEGDYYNNITKFIDGNSQHGYNIIEFDETTGFAHSCKFVPLKHIVSRHTFYINDKFDYSTMINALEINNTTFNKIRLICQSGLNSFIENEQKLIEHFKSHYGCSVSTDYAKDVLGVEVNEEEFADLNEVIDKTKILKISKTYIDAIVDRTSTIDKADKEKSKEYIYSLFETELEKTELINSSQTISLVGAKISNFMPFADELELKFNNKPLTQISGTNGIGKTKLFDFLKWIWCDKITASQNDRNKKHNYSFYFNDSSENDVVNGSLSFYVNNDLHHLEKTLTRSWKQDKKDITQEDWVENLSGSPTIKMSLESNALTSTNVEEIQSYLDNLMSFADFELFVFADSSSLDGFCQMKTEILSDIFLSVLGIDVTTTILETYNELKEEKLSKLNKPSITIDSALNKISLHEEWIEASRLELADDKKLLDVKIAEKKTIDDETNALRITLHQVDDVQTIKGNIETNNTQQFFETTEKNNVVKEIENLEQLKENSSLDELNKLLHENEKLHIVAKNDKEKHINLISTAEKDIESKTNITKSIAIEVQVELKETIASTEQRKQTIDKELDAIELSSSKLLSEFKETIRTKIDTVNQKIAEIDKDIKVIDDKKSKISIGQLTIDNELSTLKSQITSNNKDIENLSNSVNCPTCNKPKDADTIIEINKKIDEFKLKNAQLNIDIISKNEVLTSLKTQEKELNVETDKLSQDKSPWLQALKIYNDDLKLNLDELKVETHNRYESIILQWVEFNSSKQQLETDLIKINDEIKIFYDELPEKIKTHQKVKDALVALSLSKTLLTELSSKTEEFDKNIETIETSKKEIETKIETINSIDDKIKLQNEKLKQIDKQFAERLQKLTELNNQLSFALLNVEIYKKIDIKVKESEDINSQIEDIDLEIRNTELKLTKFIDEITLLKNTIDDIKEYKLVDNSLKLYKKLLGKQGLPQYIFAHIIPLINKKLNESLSSVDFRLLFNSETLELRFIELSKNISRPVQFLSGMQKTIVGLAIIHVLRLLNHSKRFDVLMIDEISGKLNDGSNLTYEAKDYQDIAKQFIKELSKHSKIYIVDHVLDFSDENISIIEVQPSERGATILQM